MSPFFVGSSLTVQMRFAIAILLVASTASAQQSPQQSPMIAQETARARQLLNSPAWVDKAWGAYFAGRLHSEDLTQPLLDAFQSAGAVSLAPGFSEEHAFLAALFDAAIQADIAVPARLLQPFEQNWSGPVLILLARSKDNDSEDALLRFADEESPSTRWLAANNLLFERKSQRWFTKLLGEIKITHTFFVTDNPGGIGIDGGSGGSCGDGIATMPKGFPPIAIYELQQRSGRGSVLLTHGPQDVYYERKIVPSEKQVGFGSCASLIEREATQLEYLGELGSLSSGQAQSLFHASTNVVYSGLGHVQSQVEQSVDAQEQGIRRVLQRAKDHGLDAAGVTLQIVPRLSDLRKDAAGPLPTIAPREISLN